MRDAPKMVPKTVQRNTEYEEVPRDKYEKLEAALKEMDAPYLSAADFFDKQIDEVLAKYERLLEKKKNAKKQRGKDSFEGDGKFF